MTLGTAIREHLDGRGLSQRETAMEWLVQWQKRGGDALSTETVTSRLSDLLADRGKGLAFFFKDPARSRLLGEVLDYDGWERLEAQASEILANGGRLPPRLLVHLSSWGGGRDETDRLFLAVEALAQRAPRLRPLALVLTDEQYRWLPRTFDDMAEDLQIERVADEAEGADRVKVLAQRQGLLVSPMFLVSCERWAAAHFDGRELVVEPPDALERFEAKARLDGPRPVEHPVEDLGLESEKAKPPESPCETRKPIGTSATVTLGEGQSPGFKIISSDPVLEPETAKLPENPCEIRRLIIALAEENAAAALGTSASIRLGWARRLGVEAVSTDRERLEAALVKLAASLGVEATDACEDDLTTLLERAHRRPVGPTCLRVGDTLHAINPLDPADNSPLLVVHHVECRPPAIRRLRDAIASWTTDDLIEDRDLLGLIDKLDPEGQERGAMLHARATLAHSGLVEVPWPSPSGDWREGMAALLDGSPPAARLRLRMERAGATLWTPAGHEARAFLALPGDLERLPSDLDRGLRQVAPMGDVEIGRGDQLMVADYSQGHAKTRFDRLQPPGTVRPNLQHEWPRNQRWDSVKPWVFIPVEGGIAEDDDLWLDALEASPTVGGGVEEWNDFEYGEDPRRYLPHHETLGEWASSPVAMPGSLWCEADRELAMAWVALRRALDTPGAIVMHDGIVLLPMSAGVFAELRVRRFGDADVPSRASLFLTVNRENLNDDWSSPFGSLCERVTMFTGYTTTGYSLPRRIHLSGRGWRADVSFVASPLFLRDETVALAGAMAAADGAAAAANNDD